MTTEARMPDPKSNRGRPTLWTPGMPTPGLKQHWRYEGGSYYVDVTDKYVPIPGEQDIERAAKAALAELQRILGADDLDPEREGDESPEEFVGRSVARAVLVAALEQPDAGP